MKITKEQLKQIIKEELEGIVEAIPQNPFSTDDGIHPQAKEALENAAAMTVTHHVSMDEAVKYMNDYVQKERKKMEFGDIPPELSPEMKQ